MLLNRFHYCRTSQNLECTQVCWRIVSEARISIYPTNLTVDSSQSILWHQCSIEHTLGNAAPAVAPASLLYVDEEKYNLVQKGIS